MFLLKHVNKFYTYVVELFHISFSVIHNIHLRKELFFLTILFSYVFVCCEIFVLFMCIEIIMFSLFVLFLYKNACTK